MSRDQPGGLWVVFCERALCDWIAQAPTRERAWALGAKHHDETGHTDADVDLAQAFPDLWMLRITPAQYEGREVVPRREPPR